MDVIFGEDKVETPSHDSARMWGCGSCINIETVCKGGLIGSGASRPVENPKRKV
jgi:hypothetical protein